MATHCDASIENLRAILAVLDRDIRGVDDLSSSHPLCVPALLGDWCGVTWALLFGRALESTPRARVRSELRHPSKPPRSLPLSRVFVIK